jgi:hypothetical protein
MQEDSVLRQPERLAAYRLLSVVDDATGDG